MVNFSLTSTVFLPRFPYAVCGVKPVLGVFRGVVYL